MEILILSFLIVINGFFALSEIALVSSKKARLEQMRLKGSKGAGVAIKLQEDSEDFLSAIQVGITLIGIVTGVYGGVSIADNVAPFFEEFPALQPYAHQIAMTVTVVIITYVSIIIGELVPKTLALSNPEKTARVVAPVIYYFSKVLFPFVWLLSIATNGIMKLMGVKKQNEQFTEAELRQMIKIASHEGVIEQEQNLIHENVFYFSDKKAYHLMTHRTDIEWIDINRPMSEIKHRIGGVHHSKVVCCKDELDNFAGVLYLKDYYKTLSQKKALNFDELIKEPIVLPENVDAHKVLNELRKNENRVCFIVNEYGGFEGIITLYDVMENIVGEIPEEGEVNEPDMFVRDDDSVLVNGDAPVEILADVIQDFEVDFSEIDYSTVAGFVLSQINEIPQVGDKFVFREYSFEIVDMDWNRIDKILITKL
ncbi:MAG: Hemolysin or related protein [Bacteroidetes bacterium]|nr:Hemolysin or related protein [Bacteroidota bacterium]